MKKIIAMLFLLPLFLSIYLVSLFIGGDSFAQAYNPLPVFQVTIVNSTSKVTTIMYVFAPTEDVAREHVFLNGWTIKDIKKLSEQEKAQITLSDKGLNDAGKGKIIINSLNGNTIDKNKDNKIVSGNLGGNGRKDGGLNNAEGNDAKIDDNISGVLSAPPVDFMNGKGVDSLSGNNPVGRDIEDNLNILPDSPDLEYLLTVNFDFAMTEPKLNEHLLYRIKSMDKGRKYVVFGHADEVVVGKNTIYKNNYTLSYIRAGEIKKIMTDEGIAAENIKTVGLGVKYPLEDTKGSSLANRRVEIYGFRTQE